MSYGYDYSPPAAQARASDRAAFIRRTYGHLAGAILAFVALEFFLLQLPGIDDFLKSFLTTPYIWLAVLGGFMVVGWIAQTWAQSDTSPAMQYMGLGLYVVAEAIIFLPLLWLADRFAPGTTQTAGIMTLTVFGGLTLGVFLTRQDFSFLGPILCIAGFAALGFIIAGIIFHFNFGLIFSFAMVALASGYILYYTSNIMLYYRTDQHVAAALALFAAVALLFWYILRIVMMSRD